MEIIVQYQRHFIVSVSSLFQDGLSPCDFFFKVGTKDTFYIVDSIMVCVKNYFRVNFPHYYGGFADKDAFM